MANLSDIRNKVIDKIVDGELLRPTASQIDDAINSSIDYYENKYFWFQQSVEEYILVEGQETLTPLPIDFKFQRHPNSLVLKRGDLKYKLEFLHEVEFDAISNLNVTGIPKYYTFRDGGIEFYPKADNASDSIKLYYWKSFEDLVNDVDENDFTIYAPRLIEVKTILDCLLDYKEEDSRIAMYSQKEKDELRTIKTETYNRLATGSLLTENIVSKEYNTQYYNYH